MIQYQMNDLLEGGFATMTTSVTRLFAATALLAFAFFFIGVGVSLSTADEPKAPDLSELKDAVKAASKRGGNVDEIQKALDALEKTLGGGFTAPKPGDPAPAELVSLREAVETAAKKGENVDEVRKQLEVVEKAMTGKVQDPPKPKPLPFPQPNNNPLGPGFGGGFEVVPVEVNPEDIQKAQEMMLKSMHMLLR